MEFLYENLKKKFKCNIELICPDTKKHELVIEGSNTDKINEAIKFIQKKIQLEEKEIANTKQNIISWAGIAKWGPTKTKKEKHTKRPISSLLVTINNALFFPDRNPRDGNNIDIFLSYLASATTSLDICVFTITHDEIFKVIANEHREGTKIRIITDNEKAVEPGSDIHKLQQIGIPVKMDLTSANMHHKFCIIDQKLLCNGSFNWTISAARRNYENIVITNNSKFVKCFQTQFDKMWQCRKHFKSYHQSTFGKQKN